MNDAIKAIIVPIPVTRAIVQNPVIKANMQVTHVIHTGITPDTYTAGEELHAGRIIVSIDGMAYEADVTNPAHNGLVVGMSLNNAERNYDVNVKSAGKVSNLGGLTPNAIYYYNSIGVIVTDKPEHGSFMPVGFALSETEFYVQLGISIWR